MKQEMLKKAIIRYDRDSKDFKVSIPGQSEPISFSHFQKSIDFCRQLILKGKIKKITNLVRDDIAILEG